MRVTGTTKLGFAALLGGAVALSGVQAAAEKKARIEPKADKVLREMSDFLSKQKSFSLVTDSTIDAVDEDGQKIQLGGTARIRVKRPDKIRIDRRGDLRDVQVFFDGKTITVYGRDKGLYAQDAAPGNLDGAIRHMQEQLDIDSGPADLLTSNPYQIVTSDVVSGEYLGTSVVNGVPTHHLFLRGRDVDVQVWVDQGPRPLPRKYVITSKKMEGSPQYEVVTSDWKLDLDLPDETFAFRPPEGAHRIEFRAKALRKRRIE